MILPSNGGPQPRSRHIIEYGISASGNLLSQWITKGGKYSNLITSEFHHISSRLFFIKGEPDRFIFVSGSPFARKVAGVVERAALEMR